MTKCASYHTGFNMGFNCAEAVNFALKNWLDYGKQSKYCKCSSDNVKIDLKTFVQNLNDNQKHPFVTNSSPVKENQVEKSSTAKKEALTMKKRKREEASKSSSSDSHEKKSPKISKQISVKSPSKETEGKNFVENWVCCDNCNKWRKIPKSKIVI